ncbi:uncharacterized protein C2845_PM11G09860 [Panicum miliaceum]|uniref:Uncharacterized protein n=1 Tax=Panicum miliaceum TaxID=4540 RepID=A0A3L6RXC2_PANMI|nr:uncharacterized protein C2845_PM11G09860 [Panicum miliaceum]
METDRHMSGMETGQDQLLAHTLRALLPVYQAITTVVLGDGKTTSFWHEDDCLADRFPALLSHCKTSDQTVHSILQNGLEPHLTPGQSAAALEELEVVRDVIARTVLSEASDRRESPFKDEQLDLRTLLQRCRDEARLWGCRLPRSAIGVCDAWCSTFVNAM